MIDQPINVRSGEDFKIDALHEFLKSRLDGFRSIHAIRQFPNGYSNLTYLVQTNLGGLVLRRPPLGANIKTAHDMEREFKVLSLLWEAGYSKVPQPVLFCGEKEVIGAEFYLMKRLEGVILRNRPPKGVELTAPLMRTISESLIDAQVELHALDVEQTGLIELGKPEGYVQRQVEGWVERYRNAQTDEIPFMQEASRWLVENMPTTTAAPCFLHNDLKFDNVVLDPTNLKEIMAILDWEMATVGDPLMDLGTTTAYWLEMSDNPALKVFGLAIRGNYTREELVQLYAQKSGRDVSDFLFYYVFGMYKLGTIVQQIYARYKKGVTKDPRFSTLNYVVRACGENASRAIHKGRISNF